MSVAAMLINSKRDIVSTNIQSNVSAHHMDEAFLEKLDYHGLEVITNKRSQ